MYILNNDIQIRGCSLEHQSIRWSCPGSECHCNVAQGGRTYYKNKISISSSDSKGQVIAAPSCGLGKYFAGAAESTKSSCVTCPRGFVCGARTDIEECRKGYATNGDGQSSCSEMEPMLIFLVVWSAVGACFCGWVMVFDSEDSKGCAITTFCAYIVVVIVMVCVIFVPEGSLGKECKAEAGTYCPPGYGRVVMCPMGSICKGGRVIESCNAPPGKYCGDNNRSDTDFLVCPVDSVCMGG